ncbi:MAG TPA: hypothetical protein VGF56_00760 [Rhizomicrobium sp.]|jgi:tetratricopeptide (TPR) repeat protein
MNVAARLAAKAQLALCDGKVHTLRHSLGQGPPMDRPTRHALSGAIAGPLLLSGILLVASLPALADTSPAANSATSYFDACATLYNAGRIEEAIAACDRTIALDPNKADAYFVKGSALFGNGKVGQNGAFVVPPGTVEVLNKYLELAPDGGHAADVHAMLDSLK